MGKEVEKMKRIWQPNDLGKVGVERRGVVAKMTRMFGPWSEVIGEAGWLVGRKIQQVALWTGPGWVGAVIEALNMRID